MAVGYLLESFITLSMLCAYILLKRWPPKHPNLPKLLLATASRAFYDNAAFFSFALQIASIVTLTRVDFGISASGMGALTVEIAWLVSTLTLMPLLPLVLIPDIHDHNTGSQAGSNISSTEHILTPDHDTSRGKDSNSTTISAAKQDVRFLLFVICWAIAFCPFFSRMSGTFGHSEINDTEGASISTVEWARIEDVCFQGVSRIPTELEALITASAIISYLLVSIVVVGRIVNTITEDCTVRWFVSARRHVLVVQKWESQCYIAMCALVFTLVTIQFWGFFRTRQLQKDITGTAGGDFLDEQWTFGQVVAVIVFLPVFVEVVFTWRKRALYGV